MNSQYALNEYRDMQLVVKKSDYWKSLSVSLQDGRMPTVANHSIGMEPAIWFKVSY